MNLPQVSLAWLTQKSLAQRQRLVVLAVSEPKMQRLPQDLRGIDTLVLNQGELAALAAHQSWPAGTHEDCATAFGLLKAAGLQRLVVTQGKSGVSFIEAGQAQSSQLQPELAQEHQVRDVSGAGDAFCSGLCASYLRYPQDALSLHVQRAMRLAVLTVQSEQSVNPAITPDLI
jgi:pseudouridine kinase